MANRNDILDDIIREMGDLGKYQFYTLSCLCYVMVVHSASHMAYVFTSMDSDYRCLIPECEDSISTDPSILKNLIPSNIYGKPSKCLVYNMRHNSSEQQSCKPSDFDNSEVTECASHVFKNGEYYIGREFNMLCEENLWALSLVGTANTFGMFLGLIVTGYISDRCGRKRLLLFGMTGCGIVGLVKTFSTSFYWFLSFELIEAIFSAGTCGCSFIMAVELVVPKRRAFVSTIMNTSYSLGEVFLAVSAWYLRSWKSLIYFIYTPCALLFLLQWFLPESVRWMLSRGMAQESKNVLQKIAKTNGKQLPTETLNRLDQVHSSSKETNQFSGVISSKCLFWRFLNCCFGWVTCAFLFYGITLNSVSLYGNTYFDFILISLTEIPAYWSMNFLMTKIGRRTCICGSYLLTSLACICFIFIPKTSTWLYLFIYCAGKFGATAAFHLIYIITSEIFPTTIRHTTMGLCSTVGRFGSITSPQTPLLRQIWEPLPLILFATMSGAAGLLSLFLPETKGVKLPDTIEEAEVLFQDVSTLKFELA